MIVHGQTTPTDYFIFNEVNSADYGVFISQTGTFVTPDHDVSTMSVPGRSGSILFDNNRFNNVDIVVPCFIPRDFKTKFDNFRAIMMADSQYHRLEFTNEPEYYRMAYVTGPINPTTGPANKSGRFDVVFHCLPQKFLKIGERTLDITATGTVIHNRTMLNAKPLLGVAGTGSIRFRGAGITEPRQIFDVTINRTTETSWIYLDCETGNAYYERVTSDGFRQKVAVNNWVQTDLSGFPQIRPGANFVYLNGDITRVQVKPNWWTL